LWRFCSGATGEKCLLLIRKPLLYPSELRGHKELCFAATTLATTFPLIRSVSRITTSSLTRATAAWSHRCVAKDLLQSCDTAAPLKPLASEGVPHLMHVKPYA
jgi:hypothetical protein